MDDRSGATLTFLLRAVPPDRPGGTPSGGVGKTRLALHVAADLLGAFPDGVWFVELDPVSEPAGLPPAIAGVLGARESGA